MIPKEKEFVGKILKQFNIQKGEGVDIGCGPKVQVGNNCDCRVFPEILLGLDTNKNFQPDLCINFVKDPHKILNNSYRFVLMSHMLEDCENPYQVLREVRRILKLGGVLLVICPTRNGTYPRIGSPGANPGHKYDFDTRDVAYMIDRAFEGQFKLVDFGIVCDRSFQVTIQKVDKGTRQFPQLSSIVK